MRENFEESVKKKRDEEPEDSKFDYLTLLVNTTKKYGNLRKAGGGGGIGLPFKHSLTRKNITNAVIKQFSSPPIIGKSGSILIAEKNMPTCFLSGNAGTSAGSSINTTNGTTHTGVSHTAS